MHLIVLGFSLLCRCLSCVLLECATLLAGIWPSQLGIRMFSIALGPTPPVLSPASLAFDHITLGGLHLVSEVYHTAEHRDYVCR